MRTRSDSISTSRELSSSSLLESPESSSKSDSSEFGLERSFSRSAPINQTRSGSPWSGADIKGYLDHEMSSKNSRKLIHLEPTKPEHWSGIKEHHGPLPTEGNPYYEGTLLNDVPEGKGKVVQGNGDIVSGTFKKGVLRQGVYLFGGKNGIIYNGDYDESGKLIDGYMGSYETMTETSAISNKFSDNLIRLPTEPNGLVQLPHGVGIRMEGGKVIEAGEYENGTLKTKYDTLTESDGTIVSQNVPEGHKGFRISPDGTLIIGETLETSSISSTESANDDEGMGSPTGTAEIDFERSSS